MLIKLDKTRFLLKWKTSAHRKAYSVKECATAVGVSESGLYAIESGRNLPGLETYFNMCLWAGLDPCEYLLNTQEMLKKSDDDFYQRYPLQERVD